MSDENNWIKKQTFLKWKSIAICHLDRGAVKKIQTLMIDVLAVDAGIKASYLYDVGAPNVGKLYSFIKQLKKECLICNNLNVLEIGMDCLIINAEALSTICVQEDCSECLINVSSNVKNGPVFHKNHVDAEEISIVVGVIKNNLTAENIQKYEISVDDICCCNVTSLFGFLLNYPLVYWYEQGSNSDGNCLSMEKLIVVKVFVSYRLEVNEKGLTASEKQTFEHCLYSFSYPSCLSGIAATKVSDWFEQLKEQLEQFVCQSKIFFGARIVSEEAILAGVSL